MIEQKSDDSENKSQRQTNLKALLESKNITQRALSDLTGMTERNIYDLVKGLSLPRLDRAIMLARSLDLSLKQLCIELGLDVEGLPDDMAEGGVQEPTND